MSFHCAQHVDVAARGTCERCGRFCCRECLAAEDLCRECNARAVAEWPSLAILALPASISMALTSLLIASTVVFNRVDAMVHFDPSHFIAGLGMLGSVVGLVISAALFLAWFYRATTHALLRHLTLTVASPTEAIGSWFTPREELWDAVRSAPADATRHWRWDRAGQCLAGDESRNRAVAHSRSPVCSLASGSFSVSECVDAHAEPRWAAWRTRGARHSVAPMILPRTAAFMAMHPRKAPVRAEVALPALHVWLRPTPVMRAGRWNVRGS